MNRFTNRFSDNNGQTKFDPKVIFNFGSLDKSTKSHLKNVYACVTMEIVAAAFGAAINCYLKSSILHFGGMIGLFVFMYLTVSSHNSASPLKRLGYVGGLAGCVGLESSYLLDYVISVDPSIIVTAFVTTSVVFVSFTLTALYAERRSMLFLGSLLSTALSGLFILSLANLFFRVPSIALFSVYISLIISCLFVMYDTQLIVEKKRLGDNDFIWHSVDLFIDFVIIFKDLMIILTDKEKKKRRNNN
ncbi:hypothetical protein ACHWQZ_G009089 [Mnemiopsis leidyi]